jgi:apolipoprotein N-acyltransferase
LWLLAAGWVVMEWLRHVGPLAFPWGTLGYALSDVPPVQLAELGGVLLLSLVVTCSAAALARAVGVGGRRDLRGVAALAVVWGAGWVFGLERASDGRLLAGEAGRALLLRTDTNSFDKAGATAQSLNDACGGSCGARRSPVRTRW